MPDQRDVPAGLTGAMTRAIVALAMAFALAISGPATLGASPDPEPAATPASASAGLLPMVVSSQFWVGDNDLILDLLDPDGVRLDDANLTAAISLARPDGTSGGEFELGRIQFATWGRWLYRAPVHLDAVGPWTASVTAHTDDGRTIEGETGFAVLPDDGTPAIGDVVVPTDTPTLESSGYDLASITTDPDPFQQLYLVSVRDALAAGHAFVLVIDTVGLGVNSACGSGVGEARTIPGAFPGLWVIHAEPWVTPSGDAVLVRDPTHSPRRMAPWATAWGVTEPPWIFIVGDDGTLRAKFQGIFGTDELLSALRHVAAYAPGGH